MCVRLAQPRSAARPLVLLVLVLLSPHCRVAAAEGPSGPASDAIVPEGTPAELVEYIKSLPPTPTEGKSRREWTAGVLQKMRASGLVADRILAHEDLDEETTLFAFRVKMTALQSLAHAENDDALLREAIAFAESYLDDPRTSVAAEARNQWLMTRAALARSLPPEEQQELLDQMLESVRANNLTNEEMRWPSLFGGTLAALGPPELAARFYEELAAAAAQSTDRSVRGRAPVFAGAVRRLRLVGKPIEIEGETFDGKWIDWESYRGRIVLVEFWATWCAPCVPEMGDLLEHYERYHDQGFDVIGITLDARATDVEKFLVAHEIPWATLFSTWPAHRGRNHPVAVRYGISGVPSGILVGRDGKVISINAKGEELDRLLKSLFDSEATSADVETRSGSDSQKGRD